MTVAVSAAPPRTGDAALSKPRNIRPIMSGVLLVLLMASLDQTIVGTAMPRVIAQLNGFDRYTWVATAYLLTSTVTVPIFGKLSDLLGRKIIFMLGIVLFVLGSALCGAAQTMTHLILFRGLQGLGAGVLVPVSVAVIGDLFPPKERGKWQGVAASVWGMAAIAGPTLGGLITDKLSWRWIFYVNLPVGLAALLVLAVVMPPLRSRRPDMHIDLLGAVLLVAGTVPLLLAFTWADSVYPWGSAQIVGLLAAALAMLAVFAVYEARHPEPILEPRLFRNRIFTICVLATMLIAAGRLVSVLFVALFIQGVAGASATRSGVLLTPLMLMAVAGSIFSGQLLSRWGRYRAIGLIGLLMMIAGTTWLLRLNIHTRPASLLPALLALGAGIGFGLGVYNIAVQNAFPWARLGQVTSALAFFRAIGGTMGVAIMGSVLTAHFTAALRNGLSATTLRQGLAGHAQALSNPRLLLQANERAALEHAFSRLGPQGAQMYAAVLRAVKAALASALHDVFLLELAIAVLAFVIVLFLPEIPLRGREADPDATEPTPRALAM